MLLWIVKSKSDGYAYGFGDAGYIYRRDADGFWERVYKEDEGRIKGAFEWYHDNGTTYLYWATHTRLHRKQIPGNKNWNDVDADTGWPKTDLEPADWHTMRDCGGELVICNNRFLAQVGYDQSYAPEVLDLVPGNVSKTLVERKGRTIVGTYRADSPTIGINGAIDAEVPIAQVGNDGELHFANMYETVPIKRLPGGGKVNPGGVCNEVEQVNFFEWEQGESSWISKQSVGNLALFAIFGATPGKGGIYSYGRKNKNHPFSLNLDHLFDADEIGAMANIDGTILFSYRKGVDYGVKAVDPDNKAVGVYEGLELESPDEKKPADITNWKYAHILCEPLPDGTSIEFWYKVNKWGNWVQAKMEGGATVFNSAVEKEAVFLVGAEGEVFEPRLVLNPSGNVSPIVHRIEIYFD